MAYILSRMETQIWTNLHYDKHAKGACKIKTLSPTFNRKHLQEREGQSKNTHTSERTANGALSQVETVTFRRPGFPNSDFIFEQAPLGPGAGNCDNRLASPYKFFNLHEAYRNIVYGGTLRARAPKGRSPGHELGFFQHTYYFHRITTPASALMEQLSPR